MLKVFIDRINILPAVSLGGYFDITSNKIISRAFLPGKLYHSISYKAVAISLPCYHIIPMTK